MSGTKSAASKIYNAMQLKEYSTKTWKEHELHPKVGEYGEEGVIRFIFVMDLLNFCFWSDGGGGGGKGEGEGFQMEYGGRRWKGYWSLVAVLRRALDEGRCLSSFC